MERKSKKMWIIGGVVLGLLAVIGITFAFFSTGGTQEQTNILNSGCLNIELTDDSTSINLANAYPITDIEGVDSTSYDFTVRNTCDTPTNYSINLESLNQLSNSLNADYIKVSLSSDTFDNIISILSSNPVATPELEDSYESYSLYTASLEAHETKTYHLKLWIDYDATAKQAASKTYTSKINVVANPETSVADALEAKFSLKSKILTTTLSNNVTSATYCITEGNMCEPTTSATISNNSYTIELEEKETNQMVCTKLNDTSKVICSDPLRATNTAGDTILANDDAPTGETTDWTGETTYYYTGNPNNWVQFAGFWWRIIRINGNKSIRMIYQGTTANATGTGTQIGTSSFNSSYSNKTYVGLVYDGTNQHGYGSNSTILGANDSVNTATLNGWYNTYLKNYEVDYIDTGTGFCSDRDMASGYSWSSNTVYYAPYDRRNGNASLQCNSEDILSKDNGKLANPIGLVTSDEAVLTGITYDIVNTESYLYTGGTYWTMSPYYLNSTGGGAGVFYVGNSGTINVDWVGGANGIRPVINIRSDVQITGTGSVEDPYKFSISLDNT